MSYRYELVFQPQGAAPASGARGRVRYDPPGEFVSEGEEYEGGAPSFDVDRAVRLNRLYGKSLGWQSNIYFVRPLLGIFPFSEPPEEDFAAAVARWQRAKGLPADGVLGPQTYARLTGRSPAGGGTSASSPGWVASLTPLLERYRGDIPLDFLIGWVKVESGGDIKSHTSLDERGYFQIHPEESKTLRLNHQLLDVDPDYSVQSGIRLIRHYMQRVQNQLKVAPGTDLFWHMVKFQHTGIGYVQVILDAMRADGVSPSSWEAIRSYVKENTARLRRHRLFAKRDPNTLTRNVDELFEWGRKLAPRQGGGASRELEGESAAIQGGEFELNFEAEPLEGYTEFDETGAVAGAWGERELEGEVNLKSPAYVRRVQSSLNRLLGLRLTVDGLWGTQTSNAVRNFQKRRGLPATGVLDARTERALFADEGGARPDAGKVKGPTCEPAAHDLEFLAASLEFLSRELGKATPSQTRLRLLRLLVKLDVDTIIDGLPRYIAAGCCEPSLKTLEADVTALPWPADPDAQAQRSRLLDAIRKAQETARKDFEHC